MSWYGERERHRQAALKGKKPVNRHKGQLRRRAKRLYESGMSVVQVAEAMHWQLWLTERVLEIPPEEMRAFGNRHISRNDLGFLDAPQWYLYIKGESETYE